LNKISLLTAELNVSSSGQLITVFRTAFGLLTTSVAVRIDLGEADGWDR